VEQQVIQLKLHRMHMLTAALRSFVMQCASEHDRKVYSTTTGLAMAFAADAVQEVTKLNMDVHGPSLTDASAEKLARDAVIWTHLAGDSVQRMRVFLKLASAGPD
jgi:alkylation response protein AidB-like acyl-CoA dehydrogenase